MAVSNEGILPLLWGLLRFLRFEMLIRHRLQRASLLTLTSITEPGGMSMSKRIEHHRRVMFNSLTREHPTTSLSMVFHHKSPLSYPSHNQNFSSIQPAASPSFMSLLIPFRCDLCLLRSSRSLSAICRQSDSTLELMTTNFSFPVVGSSSSSTASLLPNLGVRSLVKTGSCC